MVLDRQPKPEEELQICPANSFHSEITGVFSLPAC